MIKMSILKYNFKYILYEAINNYVSKYKTYITNLF